MVIPHDLRLLGAPPTTPGLVAIIDVLNDQQSKWEYFAKNMGRHNASDLHMTIALTELIFFLPIFCAYFFS